MNKQIYLDMNSEELEVLQGRIITLERQLGEAHRAVAEMRDVLSENQKCIIGDCGCPACKSRTNEVLSRTDCGKGYVHGPTVAKELHDIGQWLDGEGKPSLEQLIQRLEKGETK